MNRRFGKLDEAGNLTYAPNVLAVDGRILISPPDDAFLAAGWYKVTDNAPTPTESFYARPTGWVLTDGEIVRQYEQIAVEPTPKVYNKYRLVCAVNEAHLLTELTAYMTAHADEKMLWDAAKEFVADDPNFVSLVSQFNAAFGADTVATILAKAEVA